MPSPLTPPTPFHSVWVYPGGRLARMRASPHCLVTLTTLALLTTIPSALLVTLRTGGWIHLTTAVETTVFLPTIRLDGVLGEGELVDVPLALPPSDNISSMAIFVAMADEEPVRMSPMKLVETLTVGLWPF